MISTACHKLQTFKSLKSREEDKIIMYIVYGFWYLLEVLRVITKIQGKKSCKNSEERDFILLKEMNGRGGNIKENIIEMLAFELNLIE